MDIDGTTGTPRLVARINGFLTPKSKRGPKSVALRFVRAHLFAFGLVASDLNTFHFRKDYTDITGTHHLSWTQRIDGVEIFGNGLQASVTDKGRLQTIGGSPVPASLLTEASGGKLDTSSDAIAAARKVAGEASLTPGDQDRAQQVLFVTPGRTYLAWRTITMSAAEPALSVLDARTGRLLFRQPLGHDESSSDRARARKGLAFSYFPGHRPRGGKPFPVNYTKRGWMPRNAKRLTGNNTHTYADVNDDGRPARTSRSRPVAGNVGLPAQAVPPRAHVVLRQPVPVLVEPQQAVLVADQPQPERHPGVLLRQQLARPPAGAPIGFTEAAGNFQRVNSPGNGEGGDAVHTQTDDGANTDSGLPDGDHVDNANMATPPDGQAPRMQMYLQHEPCTTYPDGDPFSPDQRRRRGRHRLPRVHPRPVQPAGRRLRRRSTLGDVQAGAMGEAWGDWYAMDYLVAKGLQKDKPAVRRRAVPVRRRGRLPRPHEPMDCKVAVRRERCTARAARPATAAATPTPTTARSAASPRCTRTARSGRRRSGTCANGSARRCRSRW